MSESAIYRALRGGPQTVKQIAKATKLSDEEVEDALVDFKGRQWLETADDAALGKKFALSAHGQTELAARYSD